MLGMLVVAGAPAASADEPDGPADPVRLVIATAGLTWEDIDPGTTPHLQCLADRSGAGAMNTTSTSVVSTKRQGLETLRSGYRGLAERSEEHTSELQSRFDLVCRLLLEKKN